MAVSHLKAILSLDNKQFSQGLKKSQKEAKQFGDSFDDFLVGGAIVSGLSAVALAVIEIGKNMAQTNVFIKNAEIAFARFGDAAYLRDLRYSTGGMVDDLHLMQQAIQATNLGLRQSDLPTFFKFATIRAAETGVAVDYLVNSIVTGVGRESRLVLDNLGISLKELNEEIARLGGGFGVGAVSLINKKFKESGRNIEDVTSGVIRLQAALKNLWLEVSSSEAGSWWDNFWGSIADRVQGLTEEGRITGMTLPTMSMEGIMNTLEALKSSGLAEEFAAEIIALEEEIARRVKAKEPPAATTFGGAGISTMVARSVDVRQGDVPPAIPHIKWQIQQWKDYSLTLSYASDEFAKVSQKIKDLEVDLRALQDPLGLAAETFADAVIELDYGIDESIDKIYEWGEAMKEVAAIGVQALGGAILDLVSGGDPLAVLGNFLSDLGQMLVMYGSSLIALGIGEQMAISGGPYGAIAGGAIIAAAGIALAAIGGSINNSISAGSLSSGGGSYGGSYGSTANYGGVGAYDQNREVVLVARGDDLVAVINRNNYRGDQGG